MQPGRSSSLKDVPTTLEEAAQILLRDMTPDSRETFARINAHDLPGQSWASVGDYCRQCLGLDHRNIALAEDCGAETFELAVDRVIRKAWNIARQTSR